MRPGILLFLRRHGDEIAALLIEPILGNAGSITADREYVQDVRTLCDRYGVLMIIDEVKTGFRVARGGAQQLMGVTADLLLGNLREIDLSAAVF